jgi:hypothetical protein
MKVKISYSVPFNSIPDRINNLLIECSQNLLNCSGILKNPSLDEDSKLEAILNVREKLSEVDFLLEDCYSIVSGYLQTKDKLEEKQNDAATKISEG